MKFCFEHSVSDIVRKLTYIFVFLLAHLAYSQSSVLSSGDWFKVGVNETGIYKLDRADLEELGLNVGSVDPRVIKIYGNGVNGVLPQSNSETRPSDLVENSIFLSGEADGSFDEGDFIAFYALGPDRLEFTSSGGFYEKNIYSDTSYYFLTTGGANGLRIEDKENVGGTGITVSTYDDIIVFEEDQNNLLNSGRGWYGELLSNGESLSSEYTIDGISSDIIFDIQVVSQSAEDNSFSVSYNNSPISSLQLNKVPTGDGTTYSVKARQATGSVVIGQSEQIDLEIEFNGNSASARGFVDRYTLRFKRSLSFNSDPVFFRNVDNEGALLDYHVTNGANAIIWDLTDPTSVTNQLFGINGNTATFNSQSTQIEEFTVFTMADLPSPHLIGGLPNQNLRGDPGYDAVIVSHELFLTEAERLAEFHRTNDGLKIKVVTPGQIYNEFSSGRQDVSAIRDYARYVYQVGGDLKYLLFFGDCSYDYKDRESGNTNFVPTYESRNSFDPIFSHSSDDYFGFFEDHEGHWEETSSGDHTLEIGIGRLPAKSNVEAQTMVDKIIYYSTSPNTLGKWRSQIAYLADDGDSNTHASHAEQLSDLVDTTFTQYRIEKILLDAFDQVTSANSIESSPETTRALKTRIKEGTFTINFIGHGNERLWMDESVLTNSIIENLTNLNKMPIFVTATCEFGRYDDPGQESGAEKLLLNDNGGAIALLTTSRPVFASTNFELNEAFHQNIFKKINGSHQRLGDIIRITKNEGLAGPVNRNFTLLGDPMLMPAFPELEIVINELSSAMEMDTLSALEQVTFTGEIQRSGVLESNFNGRLDIVVFDEKQNFKTKGQESSPYNYTVRSNALFRGEATVIGGTFSFTFLVPKTITYQFNKGKISLYAWDELMNIDGAGSSREFVIGGTDNSATLDSEPPIVQLYLNDESFQNGSIISSSSLLFSRMSDESGITTTGNGLIQGITLELNDEIINLNQFYSADLDTYKSGSVVYPIQDLDPGSYTATIKVYDTHNNLTTEQIFFTVSDESFISLFNAKAFPNPSQDGKTTFSFEHDREEEDLELSLFVYNTHGEVVNKSSYVYENSNRLIELEWSTTTNSGQQLNQGVYFYRLIIQSRLDGAVKEMANKLVIVN